MTEKTFGQLFAKLRPNVEKAQRTVNGRLQWCYVGIGMIYDAPDNSQGSQRSQDMALPTGATGAPTVATGAPTVATGAEVRSDRVCSSKPAATGAPTGAPKQAENAEKTAPCAGAPVAPQENSPVLDERERLML